MNSDAVMAVAFFGGVAAVAWAAAFAYSRSLMRPRDGRAPVGATDAERRLALLEQATDAIAVEVERLAESQRYTVRLLEDRLPAGGPALRGAEGSGGTTRSA